MAKQPVVVIGLGEMGGVFARGLLKLGHPVYPVTRDSKIKKLARMLPNPKLVLLAVGEKDFVSALEAIPRSWRERLALLQNELLPNDFRQIDNVTVISVWFEKKKGQDAKVIIPSPVYGPRARLLARALATLDIPVSVLEKKRDLLFELVVKNLYILTTNIAGLRTGGTVSELWSQHQATARSVAEEIIALQEALTDKRFDHEALIAGMVRAFHGDPQHKCMGRSAPARLERALANAERLGIDTPTLDDIAAAQARVTH
jgi:ketopantoate reductase